MRESGIRAKKTKGVVRTGRRRGTGETQGLFSAKHRFPPYLPLRIVAGSGQRRKMKQNLRSGKGAD